MATYHVETDSDLVLTPVSELTPALFRTLLLHLKLTVKEDRTAKDDETHKILIELLSICSPISTTFSTHNPASLLVQFEGDTVVNVFDSTRSIALYPINCPDPCVVCHFGVQEGLDEKLGQGFECSVCYQWFHNQCLDTPLDLQLYQSMSGSPSFIRLFCPLCLHNGELKEISSKIDGLRKMIKKIGKTIGQGLRDLSDEIQTADVSCGSIQTSIDQTCKSVSELQVDVSTNVTTFGNCLENIVNSVNRLDNIDLNSIATAACKVSQDVTTAMNKCILRPEVITSVSNAITDNLSNVSVGHQSPAEGTAKLLREVIREEVSSLNAVLSNASSREKSWAEISSFENPAHADHIQLGTGPKTPQRKTQPSVNQNREMDITRTVSIGNAHHASLSSSAKIKSVFNKCFPRMEITHCKRSMNGFILIEVDSAVNARNVVKGWDSEKFFVDQSSKSANKSTSAIVLEDARAKAVIMDVDKDLSDDEMTKELVKVYPSSFARRFKNSNGPTFSVLITFGTKEDLQNAEMNHIFINDMRFRLRPYTSKPRVIQCYNCNKFKHIAPICSGKQVCAFCGENHKISECKIRDEGSSEAYSCSNCGKKGHSAIDKECEVYKKMVNALTLNQDG